MLANRIIWLLTIPLSLILLPVSFVSNLVLELSVKVTFGLLLLPLQVVWMVLIGVPLLGTSLLWEKAPLLRPLLAIVGVPIALIGWALIHLLPSLGVDKSGELIRCETWPFSFQFNRLATEPLGFYDPGPELWVVLKRLWRDTPLYRPYLSNYLTETGEKIVDNNGVAMAHPETEEGRP